MSPHLWMLTHCSPGPLSCYGMCLNTTTWIAAWSTATTISPPSSRPSPPSSTTSQPATASPSICPRHLPRATMCCITSPRPRADSTSPTSRAHPATSTICVPSSMTHTHIPRTMMPAICGTSCPPAPRAYTTLPTLPPAVQPMP